MNINALQATRETHAPEQWRLAEMDIASFTGVGSAA